MPKRADYISRAREAEKRAKQIYKERELFSKENYRRGSIGESYTDEALKQLNDMDIPLAQAYEDAARNWVAAKKIKKADKYYLLATRTYGDLFQSRYTDPDKSEEFRARCFRGIKVRERLEKVSKGKWHGLEGKASATAAIIGLIGGLFFLSSNMTGNAIVNISQSSSNLLSAVLLVVGLVGAFFWVKKKIR